jgi:hypothetical protein
LDPIVAVAPASVAVAPPDGAANALTPAATGSREALAVTLPAEIVIDGRAVSRLIPSEGAEGDRHGALGFDAATGRARGVAGDGAVSERRRPQAVPFARQGRNPWI